MNYSIGKDTCTLRWGVGMHQVIVWVKAADVASGITFCQNPIDCWCL